jgi:hypothetical protein
LRQDKGVVALRGILQAPLQIDRCQLGRQLAEILARRPRISGQLAECEVRRLQLSPLPMRRIEDVDDSSLPSGSTRIS